MRIMRPSTSSMTASIIGCDCLSACRSPTVSSQWSIHGRDLTGGDAGANAGTCELERVRRSMFLDFGTGTEGLERARMIDPCPAGATALAMCRLFGMTGGAGPVAASFWLLEAPDSLAEQSRRNPDGFGLGSFAPDGTPEVIKGAVAAHADDRFARQAIEERSTTYNAHVRFASIGPVAYENTHPFEQDGRLFGHNGVLGGLDELEARLGAD